MMKKRIATGVTLATTIFANLLYKVFCPNDLFTNTKSDLGLCPKIHDAQCQREWKSLDEEEKARYGRFETEFLQLLEKIIFDLDRKMERQQAKLNDDGYGVSELPDANKIKVASLTAECDLVLKKIEELGEKGLVNEATAQMEKLNDLQKQKEAVLQTAHPIAGVGGIMQEKRMRVCEVCGSYLVIGDTDMRTINHIEGKQHKGYQIIREKIVELSKGRPRINNREPARDDRRRDERHHNNREIRDDRGYINCGDDRGGRDHRRDDRDRSSYNRDRRDNGYRDDRSGSYNNRRDDRGRDQRDGYNNKNYERRDQRERSHHYREREYSENRERERGREREGEERSSKRSLSPTKNDEKEEKRKRQES